MGLTYKRLWKLLIDKDLKKKDLCRIANISPSSLSKINRNENVTTEVLTKICSSLGCDISDIVEFVPDSSNNK